jgi:hypothetical protein
MIFNSKKHSPNLRFFGITSSMLFYLLRGFPGVNSCFLLFFSLLAITHPAIAHSPESSWEPVPIRPRMLECHTFLTRADMGDGVGLPLSSGGLAEFDAELRRTIAAKGVEEFRGSTLYVTGIEMGNEAAIRGQYGSVLEKHGISSADVSIRVLSVPRSLLVKKVTPILQDAWSRLQYFFPSLKRDFQKPLPAEVLTGIASTVPLELPNAVYLLKTLPSPDAEIVLGVHTATLFAYTVFSQTLLNWLLRPGTTRMGLFLKQCLASMPFILNYRLFGNFSHIMERIQAEGFGYLERSGPGAIADFVATDGFTLVLQTVFYSVVITKGAGEWVNGQIVERNLEAARAVRPVVQAPILIADALLLAYATVSTNVLFHVGPLAFNDGHAMLIGVTALGWAAYRPAVLDFIGLRPYFAIKRAWERLRDVF